MGHGVVVVGMHRSGTSAATRLVNLLGVPLPAENDLLPSAFDNPRGHWESRSLVEFNDRLLDARACDWTCPVPFERGWTMEPPVAAFATDAFATFQQAVPTRQWVWKDPRNCLLLPFWRGILGVELAVVLVLRHPLEIVASLEARDRFERPHCIALWERYLRVCVESLAGLPVYATSYDELLSDPLAWCSRAGAFLSSQGISNRPAPERDVLAFVDPSLRHERVATRPEDELSTPQRALDDALGRALGEHTSFEPVALPPETETTGLLLEERRQALAAVRAAPAPSAS
jgi:hypothetical protein